MKLKDKKKSLISKIQELKSFVIAFSGGVDSTFLLAISYEILGEAVIAVTADSPLHSQQELSGAVGIAKDIGVAHIIIRSRELALPEFVQNNPNRCYLCKKALFSELLDIAAEKKKSHVVDGANLDDLDDFRPGMQATRELGIVSPLMEASLRKADIRALAKEMNLPTWNKPSNACLASRIPYGDSLSLKRLQMVADAEAVLLEMGLDRCRVRHHGDVARIEVTDQGMQRLWIADNRRTVVERLRKIGFIHVALDLEGYIQGSMNRGLT
jgi:uncharacterized protein